MAIQSNVVTSQPTQYTVTTGRSSDWSTNACDCCDDCGICMCFLWDCKRKLVKFSSPLNLNFYLFIYLSSKGLCGAFIPCILGCKVAQDNGDSCCLPFLPGAMIALRTSIRSKYNIEGSVCDDWVVMACLPLCGLCQMAREQKMRG
ncbi:cornifelin homolog [Xiphophorus couchianus]|uniref:cornifelin homolog n=1 Tax=Xiphophorus couchianus TaxID=32473 RepID=UPI001016567F|nr:cornifelin [Xiphophorus couchianus]